MLESFHQAWSKPLDKIIEEYYHESPEVLHLLHLRMRKGLLADYEIAEEVVSKIAPDVGFNLQTCLRRVLSTYIEDKREPGNVIEASRVLQKVLIKQVVNLFSPEENGKRLKLELTDAQFYLGLGGLKRDPEFAIELYQLALQRDVMGALPVDSPDPRILFYSVLASAMNLTRQGAPALRTINTTKFIEFDWMTKINWMLPRTSTTLEKFKLFSLKNTDLLFDDLLDQLPHSAERLQFCLDDKSYQMIMERKKKHFAQKDAVLEDKTKLIKDVRHIIFSFMSADKSYYTETEKKSSEHRMKY